MAYGAAAVAVPGLPMLEGGCCSVPQYSLENKLGQTWEQRIASAIPTQGDVLANTLENYFGELWTRPYIGEGCIDNLMVTKKGDFRFTYYQGDYYVAYKKSTWEKVDPRFNEQLRDVRKQYPPLIGSDGVGSLMLKIVCDAIAKKTKVASSVQWTPWPGLNIEKNTERFRNLIQEGIEAKIVGYSKGTADTNIMLYRLTKELKAAKSRPGGYRVHKIEVESTYRSMPDLVLFGKAKEYATIVHESVDHLTEFILYEPGTLSGKFAEPWQLANPKAEREPFRLKRMVQLHIAVMLDPEIKRYLEKAVTKYRNKYQVSTKIDISEGLSLLDPKVIGSLLASVMAHRQAA